MENIHNFRSNNLQLKGTLFLSVVTLWPYFGYYGEIYFKISSLILTLFAFLFLDTKDFKINIQILFLLIIIFIFGQLLYGIDLGSLREVLRILLLIIGFYIGVNKIEGVPFSFLVITISAIFFLSIALHPNVAFLSNIFASTPEFNHSYHYYRSIIPGGLPATSGYMLAIILIWGYINLKMQKISLPYFLLMQLLIVVMMFFTQSRLPLILAMTLIIFLPIIIGLRKLQALKLYIFYFAVFILLYSFNLISLFDLNFDKIGSLDTAQIRIENIFKTFALLNEEFYRVFPGCLFVRECHFTGDQFSITPDGGILYILMNWGVPLTLIFLTFLLISSLKGILKEKWSFVFLVGLFSVLSLFDPFFLDPKLGLLASVTLGYLYRKGSLINV